MFLQVSICDLPMRELSNPGASGSIFYLTDDDEFILKTVMLKEAEFLQKLLPGYYMNLNQNPHTLLPKFFGMFCYQCNQKNIRLIVMNNLLPTSIQMHLKFDLKGSTYKRKVSLVIRRSEVTKKWSLVTFCFRLPDTRGVRSPQPTRILISWKCCLMVFYLSQTLTQLLYPQCDGIVGRGKYFRIRNYLPWGLKTPNITSRSALSIR